MILPGPTALERPHYDLALYQLAVRNVANYSPALLETDMPQEWETLLRLTGIVTGQGPDADIAAIDAFVAAQVAGGGEVPEGRVGPERLLDILLRKGPYDLTLATSRRRRTASTSDRSSRACPTRCARRAGRSSWRRRADHAPTCPRLEAELARERQRPDAC